MLNSSSEKNAENKIILLYIIDSFKIPLTDSQLTSFVLEKEYMNYFVYKQHLSELIESKMIEYTSSENINYYLITKKGRETIALFSHILSEDQTKKLDASVSIKVKQYMREKEIVTNYVKIGENEFMVYLMAVENGVPLIDLRLNVTNEQQATDICKQWKKNSPEYFRRILDMLTIENM